MRQPARLCSTAEMVASPSAWRTARPKSHRNTDKPMAANGTSRAETLPRSSREHSTEPAPTPTEKKASMRVNTGGSACRSSRTSVGNSASRVAPSVQNQLSPSKDSQTGRWARAARSSAAVSRGRFQPRRRPSAWDGARGTSAALATPAKATAIPAAETMAGPCSNPNRALPATVPARMPRKVPASTRPLPATSSCSARWLGRMAYFSGPKNVACTPNPNSTANSRGVLPSRNPAAASAMSATSASLTTRMVRDFSNRSATCPAVADSSA